MDHVASSGDLKGKDSQPADGVLDAARPPEGGINEAADVHGECTVDRIKDSHFCEGLHHEVSK